MSFENTLYLLLLSENAERLCFLMEPLGVAVIQVIKKHIDVTSTFAVLYFCFSFLTILRFTVLTLWKAADISWISYSHYAKTDTKFRSCSSNWQQIATNVQSSGEGKFIFVMLITWKWADLCQYQFFIVLWTLLLLFKWYYLPV